MGPPLLTRRGASPRSSGRGSAPAPPGRVSAPWRRRLGAPLAFRRSGRVGQSRRRCRLPAGRLPLASRQVRRCDRPLDPHREWRTPRANRGAPATGLTGCPARRLPSGGRVVVGCPRRFAKPAAGWCADRYTRWSSRRPARLLRLRRAQPALGRRGPLHCAASAIAPSPTPRRLHGAREFRRRAAAADR